MAEITRDSSSIRCTRETTAVQSQVTTPEQESDLANAECPLDQLVGQPEVTSFSLRRSTRRTAGQHPNPFNLPQSVTQNVSISMAEVSSLIAPFRPWQ